MAHRRPSGDGLVRKRKDGRWEGRIMADLTRRFERITGNDIGRH